MFGWEQQSLDNENSQIGIEERPAVQGSRSGLLGLEDGGESRRNRLPLASSKAILKRSVPQT